MFEFDSKKSAINKVKHGIDFIEAQSLWTVPSVILESKFDDEKRFLLIAVIDSGCWTAIFTMRGRKIRIISVRRSRESEKELFYDKD